MMHAYPAPAKLNLFLHIVGRRADGYHLLQSVFQLIDYSDTVHIQLRNDGRILRDQDVPGVPEDSDLTMRAARLLQSHASPEAGANIRLEKKLPMGGGLGGGSSDAATVLLALNRLWQVDLSREALQELALKLGADVPMFIFGQTAFAEGIGEILHPVSAPPAWYVVLTPPAQVSTAAIFAALELTRDTAALKIAPFSAGVGQNDLQPVVVKSYPEVARHLEWLSQFGEARMTGSGACVFASFGTEAAARDVLRQLPESMQGFVAQGIDKHPLYDFCA
ncbi:MAG TPA: 4-(cytidine 5'-diphospho)-2-C-methyl-D-erythritol kinase [Thiobacillus sp.]